MFKLQLDRYKLSGADGLIFKSNLTEKVSI